MKKSKNISAFRIIVCLLISLYLNNIYIYISLLILLLILNYKEFILTFILLFIILKVNSNENDFIKFGIVERKINNYYVVDKLLYKAKIVSDEIQIGDIVLTNRYKYLDNVNYLKKNIKFEIFDYTIISNFKLRQYLYKKINSFNDEIKSILNKYIYNINNYDELEFNLTYNFIIYYLFRYIYSKNKLISIILLNIYSLIFYFDIKFYLIIIDYILSKFNIKHSNKFCIKIIILLLINNRLIYNYSICVPLILSLYRFLDTKISFKSYFVLISSLFFGDINILKIFLYKYEIYFQIVIILICFLVLIFPNISIILLDFIKIYSYYENINLSIRGQISIISIIFYFLLYKYISYSDLLNIILILLLIYLPLNNPFLKISFIDVGQGDSILIKLPLKKGNILIDTGSEYNYFKLNNYLNKQGIDNIDFLIITHNDSDHNGNISKLQKEYNIKNIIYEKQDIVLDNIYLKNLNFTEYNNDNDNSLIFLTNINGLNYLFTGDISSYCEKMLVDRYNFKVDVLKVSHHGSNTATSEYFVSNILPKYSIISTSGMYGHPSNIVLDILNEYMSKTYITKTSGNIEIYGLPWFNLIKTDNREFVIINKE